MIKIYLKGHELIFDEITYELFKKRNWYVENSRGLLYLRWHGITGGRGGKQFRLHFHREALNLKNPKLVVDHINGNSLDNRLCNLRICTQKENMKNQKYRNTPNRTSNYLGVYYNKVNNNWRSSFYCGRKRFEVGSFKTELEAAKAYNVAVRKIKGPTVRINEDL